MWQLLGAIAWFGLQLAVLVILGFIGVGVVRLTVLDERVRRATPAPRHRRQA